VQCFPFKPIAATFRRQRERPDKDFTQRLACAVAMLRQRGVPSVEMLTDLLGDPATVEPRHVDRFARGNGRGQHFAACLPSFQFLEQRGQLPPCAMALARFAISRSIVCNALRDELFAIRDYLHDFARRGGIEFESAAYRRLWLLLNAMIHFADRVNVCRLLLPALMASTITRERTAPYIDWKRAVRTLDPQAREVILQLHDDMSEVVMRHIFRRTIIIVPFALFYDVARRLGQEVPAFAKDLRAKVKGKSFPVIEQPAPDAEMRSVRVSLKRLIPRERHA
jgi:hypothetical protein